MTDSEQTEECEALSAIYGDAFEALAATSDGLTQVRVTLESTLGDDDAAAAVCIQLTLVLPREYPSAGGVPRFSVRPVRGITVMQLQQLDLALRACVRDNAGQQMLFSLASLAKEHVDAALSGEALPQFDVSGLEVDESLSSARTAASKQATKKLVGTPVTPESFAAWRAQFEADMFANNTDPSRGITLDPNVKKDSSRLTGREQFLMASAGSLKLALGDDDEDEDDDEDDDADYVDDDDADGAAAAAATAAAPAVVQHVIDASVFAATSTADLDNLEFSDEE